MTVPHLCPKRRCFQRSKAKFPLKKKQNECFLPVSPTFFLHMKQRFFFCFGLSSDLSCSSGVGSAFSDTEANIKKLMRTLEKHLSPLPPFKWHDNLRPTLSTQAVGFAILLQLGYVKCHVLTALPPFKPSIQFKERIHWMPLQNSQY